MALLCLLWTSLLSSLLVFSEVSFALERNDFYQYDLDHKTSSDKILLKLQKREVPIAPFKHPVTLPVPTPSGAPSDISYSISKPKKVPSHTASLPDISRITLDEPDHLLGVNGSGQRKYFNVTSISSSSTTTAKPIVLPSTGTAPPPLVHEPHQLDVVKKNESILTLKGELLEDIDEAPKFNDTKLNETIKQHNLTSRHDSHVYYNSSFKVDLVAANHYWVNLSQQLNATTHEILSAAYRRAATVTLSFDFPFYGHLIKNVTIATGGFIYTGDYVHAWLAATQYIAPLMANFDTSISNNSFVRYYDNGTAFTVEWDRVTLQDKPDDGEFTFQTTLFKSGDIVFVYKSIPSIVKEIKDDQHPVKVGLSDAYFIDSNIFYVRRKTIYEYHRVNVKQQDLQNSTVIYFKALRTCLLYKNCTGCLESNLPQMTCQWCSAVNRCSSGLDRYRQEWLLRGCKESHIENLTMCSVAPSIEHVSNKVYPYVADEEDYHDTYHEAVPLKPKSSLYKNDRADAEAKQSGSKMGVSGVLAILFLVTMVVSLSLWVIYAYRNPHTISGQILIRYRPTQWRWRRGEARYTAATIHM